MLKHPGHIKLFIALMLTSVTMPASSSALVQAPQVSEHHTVVRPTTFGGNHCDRAPRLPSFREIRTRRDLPFVLRLRYHGKSRIPPHWHPIDEHLTVLSGRFRLGMGTSGDERATTALVAGAYGFVAAKMAHYGWADGETTIQVHGIGPFVINYVNPADDPKNASKK